MPPRGLPGNANLEQLPHDATPGGWAEHFERPEARDYLRALEEPRK